jgi:hypothetical protein
MSRIVMQLLAVGVGVLVAGTGFALDWYEIPGKTDILWSDIFTGVVASVLTYLALWYQRLHRRLYLARLTTIAEMNHHIRNAITPLLYSSELPKHRELLQLTQAAVERIDWALREVLSPGDRGAGGSGPELRKSTDPPEDPSLRP